MKEKNLLEEFSKLSEEIEGVRWSITLTLRSRKFIRDIIGIVNGFLEDQGYDLFQRTRFLKKIIATLSSKRKKILRIVQGVKEEDFPEYQSLLRDSLKEIALGADKLSERAIEDALRSGIALIVGGLKSKTKIKDKKINQWVENQLSRFIEELKDLHQVAKVIEEYQKEHQQKNKEDEKEIITVKKIPGIIGEKRP